MYDTKNIFAKIVNKEVPVNLEYEDDNCLIFRDINPSAPVHLLAIPKGQFKSFDDFILLASPNMVKNFFLRIQNIASVFCKNGYRLVTNHGVDACQTVEHFHVHILGGKSLGPIVVNDKYHK